MLAVIITGIVVVSMIIFLISYVPAVDEFYKRILNGQWFVVSAERDGDVLRVDVTAEQENDTTHSNTGKIEPSGHEAGTTNIPAPSSFAQEVVDSPEVYLIQDGIYAYDEAEPLCRAYGSRLATMGDLYDAWRKGADWCEYGWVKGNKAVYPTQKASWVKLQESDDKTTRTKCGVPGLNGGLIRDKSRRFGVHCYGVKPPTWTNYLANTMASRNLTDTEHEKHSMTSEFRRKLNQFTVAPFSKIRWSDVYKTPADQRLSHQ